MVGFVTGWKDQNFRSLAEMKTPGGRMPVGSVSLILAPALIHASRSATWGSGIFLPFLGISPARMSFSIALWSG